jgi:DNA polymerase (family X)
MTGASVRVVEAPGESHTGMAGVLNQQVAERLREAAELLEQQQANPFRVGAYRRAANTVAGLDEDVAVLLEREGIEGLDALPGIGSVLAQAIAQMVRTGRWAQLERLRGAVAPEQLFQSIPGLGPELARRIHEHLDVDTLEALELAAHDGRLEQVPGIGPRRAAMLRAALAGMLARTRPARRQRGVEPGVDLLLDVDREYRQKAARGALPKIAPRRFNPAGEAWLPILHTERADWHFTAVFSNTARAHELGRVRDWVVVYFHRDSGPEGQRTVVTETHGPLAGSRVIRGREAECLARLALAAGFAARGT